MNVWERNAGKFDRPSSSPPTTAAPAPAVRTKSKSKAAIAKEALEEYNGIQSVRSKT